MLLLLNRLESVAQDLDWMSEQLMFFGAGVLVLYIDNEQVFNQDLRPTEDVDALIKLRATATISERVRDIESSLRSHGWALDLRPHRRNAHAYISPSAIPVDFVFDMLYPPGDWPIVALKTREPHALPSGRVIYAPSPALFLICKAAASRSPKRWEGAYQSHDLEDIAQLIAGCSRLLASVATCPEEARAYLGDWAREVSSHETVYGPQAYACLEGNWPRGVPFETLDRFLSELRQ